MIQYEVDVDTRDAELFVRGINLQAVPTAEVRALNKVIVTVRKHAVQEIHKVRRLKKTFIRQNLEIWRANKRSPEARVKASRRTVPLRDYGAKLMGRKASRQVVVNVTGQRKTLRHAFIPDGRDGHVFESVGGSRRIRKLHGPSIGTAVQRTATGNALRQVVATQWPVVYTRELNYELTKLARRGRGR